MTGRVAIVYTRQGCHLCEDAQQMLQQHGFRVQLIDIDEDAGLRERYTNCVPVVEIDGKVRFRGTIDRRLLRRLMNG